MDVILRIDGCLQESLQILPRVRFFSVSWAYFIIVPQYSLHSFLFPLCNKGRLWTCFLSYTSCFPCWAKGGFLLLSYQKAIQIWVLSPEGAELAWTCGASGSTLLLLGCDLGSHPRALSSCFPSALSSDSGSSMSNKHGESWIAESLGLQRGGYRAANSAEKSSSWCWPWLSVSEEHKGIWDAQAVMPFILPVYYPTGSFLGALKFFRIKWVSPVTCSLALLFLRGRPSGTSALLAWACF